MTPSHVVIGGVEAIYYRGYVETTLLLRLCAARLRDGGGVEWTAHRIGLDMAGGVQRK